MIDARTRYARALAAELAAVDALPERASRRQLERAWALAAETNAALRDLQAETNS